MTWASSRRAASVIFGIVLGFVLGQLKTVPPAVVESLIGALVICGAIVASGWRPINRQLRRIRYRPGRLPGDFVDVQVNRGPQNVVDPDQISFLTQSRKDVVFSTGYRPSRIVFRNLGGIQVRDIDLPATVPCRRGEIRVVRFTPTGFVVTEDDTVGDRVEVDIYNSVAPPHLPPRPTVPL